MRVGVYSDGLPHLGRREALAWCAARGIDAIEMGVGTWGPEPRPHLELGTLLAERGERDRLAGELREHGVELVCVNAAGNVLHPQPEERRRAQAALRGAVQLADLLGVGTVVTMSGCPGPRQGGPIGVFAVWSTVCDDESLWSWQFRNELAPYWRAFARWLRAEHAGVQVNLELHAGVAVHNPATFAELAGEAGEGIGVNLDPSHFWWQGIDPVAAIEALGPAIGFAHGKDTLLHADRIARDGVLDHRYPVDPATASWHFAAVGDGHDGETWAALLGALRAAGYDGVVSIEHEDPRYEPEESIERSARVLTHAIGALAA